MKIIRMNHLCMLNSPTLIVFTFQEFRINMQDHSVRGVSNAMSIYLVSVLQAKSTKFFIKFNRTQVAILYSRDHRNRVQLKVPRVIPVPHQQKA